MSQTFNDVTYQIQLAEKIAQTRAEFAGIPVELEVFESNYQHYRMRAEFKIWHEHQQLHYAMFAPGGNNQVIKLTDFPAGAERISTLMPQLKQQLEQHPVLSRKLFQADFLTATGGDAVIGLLYHRPLDDEWAAAATILAQELSAGIVGRSRKQKVVVGRDWVEESYIVGHHRFDYRQVEGSFTQPNGGINQQLLNWVTEAADVGELFLELYCGSGNFTLPISQHFRRVIATEINKAAITQAQLNCALNRVTNIDFLRLSSEDFAAAKAGVRPYFRLRHLPITELHFDCVLVDPPRSGLDSHTLQLIADIPRIIYVSCNPSSLLRDLQTLQATHQIIRLGLFDQFPYTHHREVAVCLVAKDAA